MLQDILDLDENVADDQGMQTGVKFGNNDATIQTVLQSRDETLFVENQEQSIDQLLNKQTLEMHEQNKSHTFLPEIAIHRPKQSFN